jgi:hypothetical protein
MKQTGSAAKFAADFVATAQTLGYPDKMQRDFFPGRLKSTVQKGLTLMPTPQTFQEMMEAAIRIDSIAYHLDKEEAQAVKAAKPGSSNPSSSYSPKPSGSGSGPSHESQKSFLYPQSSSRPPQSSSSFPRSNAPRPNAPRSQPRAPLSQEEKDK